MHLVGAQGIGLLQIFTCDYSGHKTPSYLTMEISSTLQKVTQSETFCRPIAFNSTLSYTKCNLLWSKTMQPVAQLKNWFDRNGSKERYLFTLKTCALSFPIYPTQPLKHSLAGLANRE